MARVRGLVTENVMIMSSFTTLHVCVHDRIRRDLLLPHWCLTPPWSNDNQLKLIILKSDEKA